MCLGDFHNNIEYLKIKKFHAHTVSNDGSFVAVTVQIVCSLSYGEKNLESIGVRDGMGGQEQYRVGRGSIGWAGAV